MPSDWRDDQNYRETIIERLTTLAVNSAGGGFVRFLIFLAVAAIAIKMWFF